MKPIFRPLHVRRCALSLPAVVDLCPCGASMADGSLSAAADLVTTTPRLIIATACSQSECIRLQRGTHGVQFFAALLKVAHGAGNSPVALTLVQAFDLQPVHVVVVRAISRPGHAALVRNFSTTPSGS